MFIQSIFRTVRRSAKMIGHGFIGGRRRVSQPVPNVTVEDVDRIVRRDFPSTQQEDAAAILGT